MSFFIRADPDHVVDRVNKDHPVALFPGIGRLFDGFYRRIDIVVAQDDINLNARQQVNRIRSGPALDMNGTVSNRKL